MQYDLVQFPNLGFLMATLTPSQLSPIKREIWKIQNSFENADGHQPNLAGHIKREYKLVDCRDHLEKIMDPLIQEYDRKFNYFRRVDVMDKRREMGLHGAWVNFQSKHEFNPSHIHSGVMSFALWIQVPYKIADEKAQFPDMKQNANKTACFEFHYTDSIGTLAQYTIPVDKSFEGKVVIFPAMMTHSVSPFYTSDDYRISVSGNYTFKV